MSQLRAWLRKNPQPSSLRYRNEDDEERTLALSESVRNRYKDAEEALLAARAVAVECLDAKGKVLRGIEIEAGEDDPVDSDEREERKAEKLAAKERRELAALLGAYGDRINQAFDKGSEATGRGHEQLVALVDVLTGHLTAAIVSLNNVSNRLAKATIDGGGGGSDNDAMVAQIIGAAAARFLGPAPAAPDKKPHANANGKG